MRKGYALILIVVIFSLLAILSAIFLKIVYNTCVAQNLLAQREIAFWLAEAGVENGKMLLSQNPDWYTDLPHFSVDDKDWLKSGAFGYSTILGKGKIKLVRERDKSWFYALGSCGKGVAILKVNFSFGPFRVLKWEEL